MISKQEIKRLKNFDEILIREFSNTYPQAKRRVRWQNKELRDLLAHSAELSTRPPQRVVRGAAQQNPELANLRDLQELLEEKGSFHLNLESQPWRDRDGKRYVHTLVRATTTTMWPMGAQYWLRDNITIGERFLASSSAKRRKAGKELLLSGLHFISSCAQLDRFETIVRASSRSFITKPINWPHIFAGVEHNLSTQQPEPWAHKQDAWQMLAWYILDAFDSGAIRFGQLSAKHRRFFGLIVPFLAKVSFWKCENSGSWEEIPAVRSSVRAWEHRLVVRLAEVARHARFQFLTADYNRYRKYLPARFQGASFQQAVAILDSECSKAMARELPNESPTYARRDPRYREADAALLYLLQLDYPQFLATRLGKPVAWGAALEQALLVKILSLQDDRSGAISRYEGDTYQRSGFFRNLTVAKLSALYGVPAGDASNKFAERDALVPKGRKAAWTHFVWQLASWSGRKFIETRLAKYRRLHERFFLVGLQLVTGDSFSIDIDSESGQSRVVPIQAWRMPECYISDVTSQGVELQFPSPHAPLNWAIAEMLAAFETRRAVLSS